jgi:gliding motility associated protien GldN
MKTINKITCMLMICPLLSVSQVLEPLQDQPEDIINGAYSKDHNQQKEEAYEYPEIAEKDIVWSRTIWREIDLRQKANHHFYYPAVTDRNHLNTDKMSLIDVIMEDIQTDDSKRVFKAEQNAKAGNEFKYGELTMQDKLILGKGDDEFTPKLDKFNNEMFDELGNNIYDTIPGAAFDRTNVKKWKVKEEWFFDKHRSAMNVRIIALCPVREIPDKDIEEDMFWIYFPDYRDLLVQTKVQILLRIMHNKDPI